MMTHLLLVLFSSNRAVAFALIYVYCCSLQLLNVCASVHGDRNSTVSCSSSSSTMECADLGEISYPFWGSASCAASPSYVLSNCTPPSSSTEVYWDSFSTAANGVVGPPAVTAVDASSIQISWNTSLIEMDYCAPLFSSENLSLYSIPSSIDLTSFGSDTSDLLFSRHNTLLLFNCTQYNNTSKFVDQLGSAQFVTESASGCKPYKVLCASLANTPCIQWSEPQSIKVLMLKQMLDTLGCPHFMLGVAAYNAFSEFKTPVISEWSTGSIELMWMDLQCGKCMQAPGLCWYDTIFLTKFDRCTIGCDGGILRCNTGAKVGFTVAVIIIIMLGIFLTLWFKGDLGKLCTMMAGNIRDACLWFMKVTIPIAIIVLKRALRKLQLTSYGPNSSLDGMDFDGLTERPTEYFYGTIASATKSFTSRVGEGGFSSVYKGTLTQVSSHGSSDMQIAVKVLDLKSKHSKNQFLNEVITIGRIHHVNIVRLLGFCMQADHEILIYEYVVNGSLDRWLFAENENATTDKVLGWGKRYVIALEVARGLSYLHEECRHRTVHCDIKPQNILLNEDMHPKIADFGLARLMGRDESKVMTFAKGTPGYMAPEFWMGGESQLSTKFDVYSYGMVLLELISGRRNFRHNVTLNSSSSFPAMAFKAAMEGDLQSILDSRLSINTVEGDEAPQTRQAQWDQIKTAVFVALWCIQDHPSSRPRMSEVVKYLEGGAAVSECPPQPNISTFYKPCCTPHEESSSHNDENDFTVLTVGR